MSEAVREIVVVNFAHPITPAHVEQIKRLSGAGAVKVLDVPTQLDLQAPLPPQVAQLLSKVPLASQEWQSAWVVVNLPGYAPAAAVLLAKLLGRMGHFPAILHLRPVRNQSVPEFEVAAILNLLEVREQARKGRHKD